MQSNPCNVCGGTEINLVDGYYYCAECGTQDVNVQQTLIEQTMLADGTIAFSKTKKITKILKDKIKMSSEWYKWHAFNFILAGLTEELLSLGAKESVKKKVFWIWTKYILKYQDKNDSHKTQAKESSQKQNVSCRKEDEEDPEDYLSDDETVRKKKKDNCKYIRCKIDVVTSRLFVSILYIALNLDRSDIQLTDLNRFIFEGRLSIHNCTKFVPKEIDTQSIPRWKSLIYTSTTICPKSIRQTAMLLFKLLELGVPIVPDLTKIIDKYIKELCLPLDFRDFVLSLIHIMPLEYLQIDLKSIKSMNKIPDYECACMSYILLGLKICFGLDSDYEIRLSDIVDKINEKENYLKSYKLGFTSEPTDRLFSFQEWCSFIQFRKIVICNNYSVMAEKYNFTPENTVVMEHLGERSTKKPSLRHEITMNIINKIPLNDNSNMISKKEFPATTIPFTAYTEVILDHTQDPDLRLLLCEDFTQYSMKYATTIIGFAEYGHDGELIIGVNNRHKNKNFSGEFFKDRPDKTLVFVRNCENKNWLETKQPDIDHITKIENENHINKDNDYGYESNSETPSPKIIEIDDKPTEEISEKKDSKHKVQLLEEEFENISIFDDDFKDLNYKEIESNDTKVQINDTIVDDEVVFEFNNISKNTHINHTNTNEQYDSDDASINPEKIDKTKLIQLLIEHACKIYKIPKPREKIVRVPTKRKSNISTRESVESKRRKYDKDQNEFSVNKIISSYYEISGKDILNQVSEQVKLCIQNVENNEINETLESKIEESEMIFDNIPEKENDKLEEATEKDEELNITELASNVEDSEEEIEIVVDKGDPEFDKETHDVKQLYVRLDDDFNNDDNSEIDDPALNNILDKQIKELSKCKLKSIYNKQKELKRSENDSDSDDDIPLSVLKEEKNSFKKSSSEQKLEPLIKNLPVNSKFNIWHRNYIKTHLASSDSLEFDLELNKHFPASFIFVIQECAAMVNCTNYALYKGLLTLELTLLALQKTAQKSQDQMQNK